MQSYDKNMTAIYTSLQQIQADLQQGKTTLRAIVEHYLARIEATSNLNAYVEIYAVEALQRADALDAKRQDYPEAIGCLHGMVVSIKDVICYADHTVTAGSKILEGFQSLFSATAVERLLAADAIIIGRTNCDEFAMGSSNENSHYGPVKNAANPAKVPGGSSGGAAVSVQADTCLAALGTDTGGSVRQPAAFCGIIGLKPTYGRISRHGLLAYGSSFDQIGIFARSIEDTALLLETIAGADEFDSTASPRPVEAYSQLLNFQGRVRVAWLRSALESNRLDPEIRQTAFDLMHQLQTAGHIVEPVDFEYLEYIVPAYYVLTTAEASSNLSRYDGVRYGYRSTQANSLDNVYKKSRSEGFGAEVKRRIMLGTFVLSAGYYDAYYTKAQQIRRLIAEKTLAIFENFDFILMPAAPTTAWNLNEKMDDPIAMYLADIFTVQANMTGIPGISLPLRTHSNGLPIGLQVMSKKFDEAALLAFAGYVLNTWI